ncbi:MAG: helix-turn-helix domain-containing protein, partial [Geminicoccaceae bacterium]
MAVRKAGEARALDPVAERHEVAKVQDPDAAGPKVQKERAGVQSLERAFGLIEAIARARQGIGLAELSKKVGLHNSTTFHLVKTMVALGYIRQD